MSRSVKQDYETIRALQARALNDAHKVEPAWSVLYGTHKCSACGKWAYQTHGGEWKHGGKP